MTALVRMRLTGFTITGRALVPLVTVLAVLATSYGGGPAQVGEAYGFSAVILFPVLAWQTKLQLDAEPDVQRRLAVVAAGSPRREIRAGLVAAVVAAVPMVILAVVLPWAFNGVEGPRGPDDLPLSVGFALGTWALVLVVPPSVALGALASRAVTRTVARGAAVLVTGSVLAIVLGVTGSPAPWLAPPLLAAARGAATSTSGTRIAILSGWALVWSAAVLTAYVRLRRSAR